MTVDEMIKTLTELKEVFDCGDYPIAMCKGCDEFGCLSFRNAENVTLNFSRTETDAGVIIWSS